MVDVTQIFSFVINFFWPNKFLKWQIKIERLNPKDDKAIQEFIDIYEEAFPYDGTNYTSGELLELIGELNNNKKHVQADNIILVAKYKSKLLGFVICFYYPEKQYGIIGYFGRSKEQKEAGQYIAPKLLKHLKEILLNQHNCKLLVFELEPQKRERSKMFLFKLYARNLDLKVYELDIDYYRPKLTLEEDQKEKKLVLAIIPISETIELPLKKERVIDILSFVHFYCYGDYYDTTNTLHSTYQLYMDDRMNFYESTLPDEIKILDY